MSENNVIDQSVTIKASRPDVFEALTQASELMRWFPTKVESDPKTGGAFRYEWEWEDASQNGAQAGKYTDVVTDERLAYTWRPAKTRRT